MKKKLLFWIDLIGISLSLTMLLICIFIHNDIVQSIMISLSTNIFTSLLLLSSVDMLLNSQAEKLNKKEIKRKEKTFIINYNEIIEILISMYTLEYNQLTIPINKRTKNNRFLDIDDKTLNQTFTINDLCDFAGVDILTFSPLGESIICGYKSIYGKLIDKILFLLTNGSFEYYPNLQKILSSLVKDSLLPQGLDTLISFTGAGKNSNVLSTITSMIDTYQGNPMDDYKNQKYSGNLFLNVILLYIHLIKSKKYIEDYKCEIEKIKNGK